MSFTFRIARYEIVFNVDLRQLQFYCYVPAKEKGQHKFWGLGHSSGRPGGEPA